MKDQDRKIYIECTRLSKSYRDKFTQLAKQGRRKKSELLRVIVEDWIDNEEAREELMLEEVKQEGRAARSTRSKQSSRLDKDGFPLGK